MYQLNHYFQPVPVELLPEVVTAAKEDRLSWRVTDQHGRSCNGGSADPLPIRQWSPVVENPVICESGWHTTNAPHHWHGYRVWLVEGRGLDERQNNKSYHSLNWFSLNLKHCRRKYRYKAHRRL